MREIVETRMSSKIPVEISFAGVINFLGVIGVIGSLIFVGLEMRQSQRIALAAQNTARTEMFTQMVNTWTESKFQWGSGSRLYGTDAYDFHPSINLGHLVLYILDNDYLQYNLGLMDENVWRDKLEYAATQYAFCEGRVILEDRETSISSELLELIREKLPKECRYGLPQSSQ